ncbi:MAG: hypothetical protein EBX52_04535 [Proteobacteria bacterium]|nr:hypothetical protein [Pseudomonadota bacterium]
MTPAIGTLEALRDRNDSIKIEPIQGCFKLPGHSKKRPFQQAPAFLLPAPDDLLGLFKREKQGCDPAEFARGRRKDAFIPNEGSATGSAQNGVCGKGTTAAEEEFGEHGAGRCKERARWRGVHPSL